MSMKTLLYPVKNDHTELWRKVSKIEGVGFPSPSMELVPYQFSDSKDIDGLYKLLGVPPTADYVALKNAYKKRVKTLHPDVNGNIDEYEAVVSAYRVLSKPLQRREYDNKTIPQHNKADLLKQVKNVAELPLKKEVTVGATRYTYYEGYEGKTNYDVILQWYSELIKVFQMFGIRDKPRVAVHDLGEAFNWSVITSKSQIAHFDRSIKPSFVLALAATLKSKLIKIN